MTEHDGLDARIAQRPRLTCVLLLAVALVAFLACLGASSALASNYADLLDTYWDVHDQVLFPTERGRHYIDLFWATGPELCQIVATNPQLADDGLAILVEFERPLRALVDGKGSTVVISTEMALRVDSYLQALQEVAGPELRATIDSERQQTPLEELVGLTFEEARVLLVGLPVDPLPGPLPTRFP